MTKRGRIYQELENFFIEDNWPITKSEEEPIISMGFKGENGQWICIAMANEEQEQCVFYSVLPVNVPEKKRQAVEEYVTRANYGMIIGNFEMDLDGGEVRYKTSMDVEGSEIKKELIKQMVYANITTTDRYLPALFSIIYTEEKPKEVIKQIEEENE